MLEPGFVRTTRPATKTLPPNPALLTVTWVPTGPAVGLKLLMAFGGTVKVALLLADPFIQTVAEPVVMVAGASATIWVSLQVLTVAPPPLMITWLFELWVG
jgi:hypothetical protein